MRSFFNVFRAGDRSIFASGCKTLASSPDSGPLRCAAVLIYAGLQHRRRALGPPTPSGLELDSFRRCSVAGQHSGHPGRCGQPSSARPGPRSTNRRERQSTLKLVAVALRGSENGLHQSRVAQSSEVQPWGLKPCEERRETKSKGNHAMFMRLFDRDSDVSVRRSFQKLRGF